jgi:hypothetical protein
VLVNYLKKKKATIGAHFTNSRGMRVNGKFLIIESDDWGAIRTPSKAALSAFEKRGLALSASVYKNDSLESNEDLEELFNLLTSIKDKKGAPLKFTANAIMANPDFVKIRDSTYTKFYFEAFQDTLLRSPSHDQAFAKWKQGIAQGLFQPQFHGREHLQYNRWLKVLRSGNEDALACFDLESTYSGKEDYSFMEAYDWNEPADIEDQNRIVAEGLQMFKNNFGFTSKSFIAPCYNWDPKLEPALKANGITIIQGLRNQLVPTGTFNHYKSIPHYFGEVNESGQSYNIRNCFLEPSLLPGKDWVDSCLAQIQTAFLWQKPAVICSHRINYIGFIDKKNRERGLKDLKILMKTVLRKWPDVQFISTDQLEELSILKQTANQWKL